MQATVYTKGGKKSDKKITLKKSIFEVKPNTGLIHQLFEMQRSNARSPVAHTLTRGERRGSTRKIYRQKGTGRARMGANRSPIRKKGGIVFGPRSDRNFEVSMNKKERRAAIFGLLSEKLKDKKLSVLVDFAPEKTKEFAVVADSIHKDATALYVVASDERAVFRSGRNIPTIKLIHAHVLNPADLLKHDHVVFTEKGLESFSSNHTEKDNR